MMLEWYNEHLILVKKLPNDIMPISKISDNITISVMFSPVRNQHKYVLDIVGNKGEYIGGKDSKKLGKMTVFNVEKELYFPFKK